MNKIVSMLIMSSLTIGLCFSCVTTSTNKADSTPSELADHPLLKHVPVDVTYAFAFLKNPDRDVLVEMTLTQYDKAMAKLIKAVEQEPEPKTMVAILQELQGKMSVEGLKQIGLDHRAQGVVYSTNLMPIIRLELHDPALFTAFYKKILAHLDIKEEKRNVNQKEISYLRAADFVSLAWMIEDNQLILGMTSAENLDKFIDQQFVQIQLPQKSLANSDILPQLIKIHDFSKELGFVDFNRLYQTTLDLSPEDELKTALLASPCKEEIANFIRQNPRMAIGNKKTDAEHITAEVIFESTADWVKELPALSQGALATPLSSIQSSFFSIEFGLNYTKLLNWLVARANKHLAQPYQCTYLAELNDLAVNIPKLSDNKYTQAAASIKGNSLVVNKVAFGGLIPTVEAYLQFFFDKDKPEELIQKLSALAPALFQTKLKTDGQAVMLPELAIPMVGPVYGAQGKQQLAFGVGESIESALAELIKQPLEPADFLMRLHVDHAEWNKINKQINKATAQALPPEENEIEKIFDEMEDIYSHSIIRIKAEPRGLVLHMSAKLKADYIQQDSSIVADK
jgi:hypothetical protein